MLGVALACAPLHSGAAPQATLEPPAEAQPEACTSKGAQVPDAWCETNCKASPRASHCLPVCKCPGTELKKYGPPPPAPEPRIMGGWTDCGPETGIQEWLKKKVLNPEAEHGQCHGMEKAIEAAFESKPAKPGREPSYSFDWGANAILPGRFGGGEISPIVGSGKDYAYHWLTVGGQDTDSKSWQETAEKEVIATGAKGVAFDIEGGVTTSDMLKWIKAMRPKHPDWTFVHVPDTAEGPVMWNPKEGPDYVAPMMYYSNFNSYWPYTITPPPRMELQVGGEAANVLRKLHEEAGWPASRIILTYQSFDAARSRTSGNNTLLPLLGKLLSNNSLDVSIYGEPYTFTGPYAGVLGWPAQCGLDGQSDKDGRCWPEADRTNMREVVKAAKEHGVRGLG